VSEPKRDTGAGQGRRAIASPFWLGLAWRGQLTDAIY